MTEDTNIYDGLTCAPTMRFRFLRGLPGLESVYLRSGEGPVVLQQQWVRSDGSKVWRDVPVGEDR